jgi:hypothetical protein
MLRALFLAAALLARTSLIDGHIVHFVIAQLSQVRVEPALGGPHVGDTAWLEDMARRDHAIAAINGGYFEAYRPGIRKNLIHTLVIDGSMVFKGDVGSMLYFDSYGHASIERVPLRIDGFLDGSDRYPNNWYAYWINRLPEGNSETITIFTPAWGTTTGLSGGPQVQVTSGVVTAINEGATRIPPDGYVIYFRGEERVASHFWIGRHATYGIMRADGFPMGDFADAQEALGGGPQLLAAGRIVANPALEGFNDPKVYGDGLRSMIGISRDQSELIMATTEGTLVQCARIMQRLGAYDAMNLDGGASSGLWANGRYLTSPGREINNALLLLRR